MKRSHTPPANLTNGALRFLSQELGKGSAVMLSAAVLELPGPGVRGHRQHDGYRFGSQSEAPVSESKTGGTVKVYLPNQQRTVVSPFYWVSLLTFVYFRKFFIWTLLFFAGLDEYHHAFIITAAA